MLDDVQPSYSALIAPDFVAFAAAEGLVSTAPEHHVPPSEPVLPDPAPPPVQEDALVEAVQPAAPPEPSWPVHRLRQDGGPPLDVQSLCLFTHHDTATVCCVGPDGAAMDYPVDRTLTLYLKPDGTSLAHLVCIPDADAPARPVHRIAEVVFAADLEGFLTHHGADLCFAVGAHPAWPTDGDLTLPLSPKLGASHDTQTSQGKQK